MLSTLAVLTLGRESHGEPHEALVFQSALACFRRMTLPASLYTEREYSLDSGDPPSKANDAVGATSICGG